MIGVFAFSDLFDSAFLTARRSAEGSQLDDPPLLLVLDLDLFSELDLCLKADLLLEADLVLRADLLRVLERLPLEDALDLDLNL